MVRNVLSDAKVTPNIIVIGRSLKASDRRLGKTFIVKTFIYSSNNIEAKLTDNRITKTIKILVLMGFRLIGVS